MSLFLVTDLPHLTQSLPRLCKVILQLQNLDLYIISMIPKPANYDLKQIRTCCSISLTLNSCPLNVA